jgi:hypothetical protein
LFRLKGLSLMQSVECRLKFRFVIVKRIGKFLSHAKAIRLPRFPKQLVFTDPKTFRSLFRIECFCIFSGNFKEKFFYFRVIASGWLPRRLQRFFVGLDGIAKCGLQFRLNNLKRIGKRLCHEESTASTRAYIEIRKHLSSS